jgi:hypothetical protein
MGFDKSGKHGAASEIHDVIGAPGSFPNRFFAAEYQYAITLYCNGFMLREGCIDREDYTIFE